jgi:anti-sigma factor (TIGR02949 family)
MDCHDVREQLLDFQRGRLAPDRVTSLRRHLDGCADCAHADAVERELTQALERRTPQYPAPVALKRRLAASWPAPALPAQSGRGRPWLRLFLPAALATAALLLLVPSARELVSPKSQGATVMVGEAVNDHVRMLQSQRPLEVESSGIHQVLPWFSGRLDFAPAVHFPGDAEFPLRGGAVGYFVDRKAAALVFGRRLHSISLFVFKADGLPWPTGKLEPAGRAEVYRTSARGFNVLLWRDGELGYALVSDVNAQDLMLLASKLSPPA